MKNTLRKSGSHLVSWHPGYCQERSWSPGHAGQVPRTDFNDDHDDHDNYDGDDYYDNFDEYDEI